MASNYTGNYNLCQWEATDAVLRTDFNEDNAKVDAALGTLAEQAAGKAEQAVVDSLSQSVAQKADQSALSAEISARTAGDTALQKKAGLQLIRRVTISQQQEWINLDLSDIDWSQWATVRIVMKPVLNSGDGYRTTLCANTYTDFSIQIADHFHMILYPTFDPDMKIIGHFWPPFKESSEISLTGTFCTIQYIQFGISNSGLLPGTIMEIWGSK